MRPAMKPATGLVTCSLMKAAACSSALPPISPIIRMASVAGICLEQVEQIDERRADDRVAADADGRRLAKSDVAELPGRFVGQRAAAADEPDRSRLMDVAGHDADLGDARSDHAGAIRADEAAVLTHQVPACADHVEHGNPSVMATMRPMPASAASRIASAQNGGRDKDQRTVRPGFRDGLLDRVEHGKAVDLGSAFARRDAPDHRRAVRPALLAVKEPSLAGDALADDSRVLVDQNAHEDQSSWFGEPA